MIEKETKKKVAGPNKTDLLNKISELEAKNKALELDNKKLETFCYEFSDDIEKALSKIQDLENTIKNMKNASFWTKLKNLF